MGGFNIDIFTVTVKADKTERLCCLFHLTLANRPLSFQHAKASETGLGDFHKLSTFFKCQYSRLKLKVIHYRNCKNLSVANYLDLKKSDLSISTDNPNKSYPHLSETIYGIVEKHAALKKKTLRGDDVPFINKIIRKETYTRS